MAPISDDKWSGSRSFFPVCPSRLLGDREPQIVEVAGSSTVVFCNDSFKQSCALLPFGLKKLSDLSSCRDSSCLLQVPSQVLSRNCVNGG